MFTSILLAIDINDVSSARKVAETGTRLARDHGASLHVINVIPDFGMSIVGSYFSAEQTKRMISDERKRMEKWAATEMPEGIEYDLTVVKGHVYDNILKTADRIDADVIVLASHKPDFEDYLLGPNAARVVRHARQSVFVVRG